uniref:Uncharacterized protein n=1 Tax=Arundo donax TaxID=35708 RepID=A0A0A9BRY1_ARUDO
MCHSIFLSMPRQRHRLPCHGRRAMEARRRCPCCALLYLPNGGCQARLGMGRQRTSHEGRYGSGSFGASCHSRSEVGHWRSPRRYPRRLGGGSFLPAAHGSGGAVPRLTRPTTLHAGAVLLLRPAPFLPTSPLQRGDGGAALVNGRDAALRGVAQHVQVTLSSPRG